MEGKLRLRQLLTNLQLDVGDADGAYWTDDELTRAIDSAIGDIDRLVPQQLQYEVTILPDVTGEGFSTGTAIDLWINLANGNIKPKTEVVTSSDGVTTYTRDTDFAMDYINGKIMPLSTGSMPVSEDFLISYTKSKVAVDLSPIENLMRVVSVEYPTNRLPQAYVGFKVAGRWLYVQTTVGTTQSQTEMTSGEHLVINYEAANTRPTEAAEGSYPNFLDHVLLRGASAYCLYMRAAKLHNSAFSDLDLSRTEVGGVAGILSAVELNLAEVDGHLTNCGTALGWLVVLNGLADDEMDEAPTHFLAAAAALAKVTTHEGESSTALAKVATACGKADAALDKVGTLGAEAQTALGAVAGHVAGGVDALSELATILTAIDAAIYSAIGVWDTEEQPDRDGAHVYLNAGDDYINKVNVGVNVAELFARYAEVGVAAGRMADDLRQSYLAQASRLVDKLSAILGKAAQYISAANARASEATERVRIGESYIAEATQRSQVASNYLTEASQRSDISNAYIQEANQRLGIASGYINLAAGRLSASDRFLVEAQRHLDMAQAVVQEANARLAEVQYKIAAADQYARLASQESESAVRIREEAIQHYNEYWRILGDRAQHIAERVVVSAKQPKG
jgi:hypothetical protein